VIAAWILVAALAPAPAGPADAPELLRLEQVWNDAHVHGDAAALEALWAEDLVVTVPRMPVITRATAITMARSGRIKFERYASSDIQVHLHGDTAVVTGRLVRARRMNDQQVEDHWQFTKVYLRQDGHWLVIAFHASEAPEP
jgi:ketosteroid isomerase-like protein